MADPAPDPDGPPPRAWSDTDHPVVERTDALVDDPSVPFLAPGHREADSGAVDTSTELIDATAEPADEPDESDEPDEPVAKPNLTKHGPDQYDAEHYDIADLEPEPDELPPASAQPVVVPGTVHHLRRWMLVVALLVVWTAAAAAGLGLYQWWYDAADPTAPLFVLAVYVLVTTVAALLLAMVEAKPWLTACAIAVLTAPFASVAVAAAVHGASGMGWVSP